MKIKDIHQWHRPREKLVHYGPDKLSNEELLAIIIGSGTKKTNAIQLSKKVLRLNNNHFDSLSYAELKHISGLGIAKVSSILASIELGKRLLQGKKTQLILSPKDVWTLLKDIRDSKKEHFVVIYLDTRNQVLKYEIISIGTLNASIVHPREVFEPAIKYNTAQIIVAHNHPSGVTDPSAEDIELTKRLVQSGDILGIEIIDHVIVTKNSYLSMKLKKLI